MAANVLDQSQLAELLGVTERRVRQLLEQPNPPPQDAPGRYPCFEAGRWLRNRWIAEVAVTVSSTGETYDYNAEKARLTFHQANISSLEEEIRRGNLIPSDVVKESWQNVAATIRAKLLNVPGRASMVLSKLTTPAEIERELRVLMVEVLEELNSVKTGE